MPEQIILITLTTHEVMLFEGAKMDANIRPFANPITYNHSLKTYMAS